MLEPPQTPQTPLPPFEEFTLHCGNRSFTFENDIFMKMSKRCARLIGEGTFEETISGQIRVDTFEAFIAACMLKPFKVTSQNAYELLHLAEHWEVNSLIKFVTDYISKKGLNPPPDVDFLGILIDNLQKGVNNPSDIDNVANYINDTLRDERFERLPPEIIFKVVNTAEYEKIDQTLLINYTLHLLETKPTHAVPLILLIDFDAMQKSQRDFIFAANEVHELNLGYFITQAFSSARNRADRDLNAAKSELEGELNTLRDGVKKKQEESFQKMKDKQNETLSELRDRLNKMAEQLKDLQGQSEVQRQRVEQAAQNHDSQFTDMNSTLSHIDQLIQQRNAESASQSEHVAEEVSHQMDELSDEMNIKIKEVAQEDAERCNKLESDAKKLIDAQQKRLKQLKSTADEIVNMLNDTNDRLYDLKAKLASKIVRDRLRFDKFIRKTDNRFDLFNKEPGLWDLKESSVQSAEKFIEEIEEQVDKFCPIRGKANQIPGPTQV